LLRYINTAIAVRQPSFGCNLSDVWWTRLRSWHVMVTISAQVRMRRKYIREKGGQNCDGLSFLQRFL